MSREFTPAELEAYLDEALPPDEMKKFEEDLRADPDGIQRLSAVNERRNAGVHTLGEIWRRHQVSCPSREMLKGVVMKTLDREQHEYVYFHIDVVGCRICNANLEDLKSLRDHTRDDASTRRKRFSENTAPYLKDSK